MGLFAPEIVLYTAFRQRQAASMLVGNLNQLLRGRRETQQNLGWENSQSIAEMAKGKYPNHPHHQPSGEHHLAYGFYVVMGGFVAENVLDLDGKLTRGTITPKGVAMLA